MKNLKGEGYKIRMTPDEKAAMRAQIFGLPGLRTSQPSPYFFFNFQFATKVVALCLVILIVGGGGVAYAAQGSLPGDALYAVKVNVTEPIQTALAVTPEGEADVHVELAERRVEEAEALASQGKLDATTTAELEQNFNDQTQSASDLALEVGHSDPAAAVEINAKIASSLSVHGAILAALGENKGDGVASSSSAFAARVLAQAQAASASSSDESGERVAVATATAMPTAEPMNVRTFASATPASSTGEASTSVSAASTSSSMSSTTAVSATSSSQNQAAGSPSKENSELEARANQALGQAQHAYDADKQSFDATTTAALDAQFDQAAQYLSTGDYSQALTLALKLQAILSVGQNYRADIAPLLNLQLNLGANRHRGNN